MAGDGPQGRKESEMTEATWHTHTHARKASSLSPETTAQTQGSLLGFLYLLIRDSQLGEKTGLKLTNKFWCPKNVLKFNSVFYFMSQAKVNQLDVWNGNILVQQHNVFWLGNKKKRRRKEDKRKDGN